MIYYIIAAVPLLIVAAWKAYQITGNKKWRKNIRPGDQCFFVNILGKRSFGTVHDIKGDKARVLIPSTNYSYSSGWYEIRKLRIY